MGVQKRPREADERLDVVVVCCGEPKKSMGWFHLTQLLEDPLVNVTGIIEPFFLGPGKATPGAKAFETMRTSLKETHPELAFYASTSELPANTSSGSARKPLLALVAGRTCDAPTLFSQLVAKGVTHVYLEKPGAENAAQLQGMRELATQNDVAVVIGYNKNVAEYVRHGLASLREGAESGDPLPSVTLEHCNEFSPGQELVEFMSGPGGEGMLHNMCCHELALAVSVFGVTSAAVSRVTVDRNASALIDLGEGRSDFQKVAFTIELSSPSPQRAGGVSVSSLNLAADRCGGNFSRFHIAATPKSEKKAFSLPDEERKLWIKEAQIRDPEIRPYFLQQAPDYKLLKETFIEHILSGTGSIPAGVVGLQDAEEALRLADMLVPALKQSFASGEAWVPATPKQEDAMNA